MSVPRGPLSHNKSKYHQQHMDGGQAAGMEQGSWFAVPLTNSSSPPHPL